MSFLWEEHKGVAKCTLHCEGSPAWADCLAVPDFLFVAKACRSPVINPPAWLTQAWPASLSLTCRIWKAIAHLTQKKEETFKFTSQIQVRTFWSEETNHN